MPASQLATRRSARRRRKARSEKNHPHLQDEAAPHHTAFGQFAGLNCHERSMGKCQALTRFRRLFSIEFARFRNTPASPATKLRWEVGVRTMARSGTRNFHCTGATGERE